MHRTLLTALTLALLLPVSACGRRKAPLTPAPPDWLAGAVDEQAQRAAPGAVRVGQLYKSVAFRSGDREQWHVQLDGPGCIHLSSAGDRTVEKIALYLWGPDGDRLETKKGDTPRTMLRYCSTAPQRGQYKFEAKVTRGHGHFAVGLYADGGGYQGRPAGPGPEPGPEQPGNPGDPVEPSGDDLDDRVTSLASASAPGAKQLGDPFEGNTSSTDWYVALETGKCYWFVGAGEPSIDKLSLYLWDPEDVRVKASKATTNEVTVGHCPTASGMHHFRAQVNGGQGDYQVRVYAKKQ